ncbi:dTDP-4-dehydrorhamnose 3,5-epimerase [Oryzisolibacter propanilivorax]|uniref:dTDP-4-dehydrorhamnose 3,5-epimerase n=1 Tax=Oryzisolibacter propanilivorax TaxID=1527607 RepID=A0A1G9V4K7_9BURK|nr:dTDP-4-dehydrorhamnose 3,5-epimerase [Oryzisolibacter propanilivorax]SDM67122.1 dTDP-4-dehydrorhamnose 3,5-epimerase [Oryzisolibacter propanilivorax]
MRRLLLTPLPLPGLVRVQRQPAHDARGSFERWFCADELAAAGWARPIAQLNRSLTRQRGSVRGLHYQLPPHAETKLVGCLRGAVWDVAVDLRAGSPTFLRWHAECLSADNACALLIPPGFAHGFQALSDDAELLYCHDTPHAPGFEAGLHPQDARLDIAWPLPVTGLSPRDQGHAPLTLDFQGVRL